MKFYGEADLRQNDLRAAVIPLDTNFPSSPKAGQLVFKDRVLMICVEVDGDIPIWVPLTNEITTYTHTQSSAASQWTVTHPLKTLNVSVTTYDDVSQAVIPADIEIVDQDTVVIDFVGATTGKAVILAGYATGALPPEYAFIHNQTSASTSWVITHNLGRNPIVRTFIDNREVQPQSVTFDSTNQLTVTFSTAQAGQAKLI